MYLPTFSGSVNILPGSRRCNSDQGTQRLTTQCPFSTAMMRVRGRCWSVAGRRRTVNLVRHCTGRTRWTGTLVLVHTNVQTAEFLPVVERWMTDSSGVAWRASDTRRDGISGCAPVNVVVGRVGRAGGHRSSGQCRAASLHGARRCRRYGWHCLVRPRVGILSMAGRLTGVKRQVDILQGARQGRCRCDRSGRYRS